MQGSTGTGKKKESDHPRPIKVYINTYTSLGRLKIKFFRIIYIYIAHYHFIKKECLLGENNLCSLVSCYCQHQNEEKNGTRSTPKKSFPNAGGYAKEGREGWKEENR